MLSTFLPHGVGLRSASYVNAKLKSEAVKLVLDRFRKI